MNNMHECIQNCLDCYKMCKETAVHCMQMGGEHSNPQHINLLLACSEMCLASANQMIYKSPIHTQTCGSCSQICQLCAKDCKEIGGDDEQMQKCVEACQKCAKTCGEMSK